MSNQEAIALLRNLEDSLDSYCELNEEGKTAFRMAIEALSCSEFLNNSDTIYRQQAIDEITEYGFGDTIYMSVAELKRRIEQLPSAQPKIIRCKDCKFYGRADKRRFYRGSDCLNNRIDTIVPDRDFCSKAERREE